MISLFFFESASFATAEGIDDSPPPPAAAVVLNKAARWMEDGKADAAVLLLQHFQDKEKSVDAHTAARRGYSHFLIDFTLGNCFLMLDKNDAAIAAYEAVVRKNPSYAPGWMNLAKSCYDAGRFREAGRSFENGYTHQALKNARTLYYSAVCFMRAEDYEHAEMVFKRLLEAHPDDIPLQWKETLVQLYFAMHRPEDALGFIEELAMKTTGEKQSQWQEILLYQYVSLNMTHKAIEYAQWLTRTYPLAAKWWKALAHVDLTADSYEKGLAALMIYSFLSPVSKAETMLMGDLNLAVNIPAQAVKYYEALPDKDMSVETVKKIVSGYIRSYDMEKAMVWVDRGLAISEDKDLLITKGYFLYDRKEFKLASDVFRRMTRIDKTAAQAWLMLGFAAMNTGDIETAEKALARAVGFEATRESAEAALDYLQEIREKKNLNAAFTDDQGE